VPKSNFTSEYRAFRELLRDLRVGKGVTQAELSTALGMAQSFVSKYEMGERRLDFVEVSKICLQLEITLESFVESYSKAVSKIARAERRKAKGGTAHE
jgi:transcriptional regulator with XRE-family HTH domain